MRPVREGSLLTAENRIPALSSIQSLETIPINIRPMEAGIMISSRHLQVFKIKKTLKIINKLPNAPEDFVINKRIIERINPKFIKNAFLLSLMERRKNIDVHITSVCPKTFLWMYTPRQVPTWIPPMIPYLGRKIINNMLVIKTTLNTCTNIVNCSFIV